MTARLILISHASTEALRQSAFPADESIDDKGRIRAVALATHLPHADRCWTSPELRTRQTADALQLNADVDPVLRDCDYGDWAGLSFDNVMVRDPEAASAWLRDPAATPPGGDSILSLMQRVAGWLAWQITLHERTIIVTHPSIIRAAIVHAIEATPKTFFCIDITPLSMTRLSGADGRWNLRA